MPISFKKKKKKAIKKIKSCRQNFHFFKNMYLKCCSFHIILITERQRKYCCSETIKRKLTTTSIFKKFSKALPVDKKDFYSSATTVFYFKILLFQLLIKKLFSFNIYHCKEFQIKKTFDITRNWYKLK